MKVKVAEASGVVLDYMVALRSTWVDHIERSIWEQIGH